MAKRRKLTLAQWVDRLLSTPAAVVRKARSNLPAYVILDELGAELWKRRHLLVVTKYQIVILKDAHVVFAS
jgi:hypothetical protein